MKNDDKKLLKFGLFNAFSFVWAFVAALIVDWLLIIFGTDPGSMFFTVGSALSLCILVSPAATCLVGIVCGILKRKQRYGLACCVLSCAGLVLAVLVVAGIMYIGGHY